MGHRGTLLAGGMPAQFPGGDRTAFISRKGQPGSAPRVSKCDSVAISFLRRARTVRRYIRRTGAIDSADRLKMPLLAGQSTDWECSCEDHGN